MTREEEMLSKATDYSEIKGNFLEYDDCGDVCDDKTLIEKAFIEGVKYADKTMLDRACEWLELRISVDVPVETNENGEPLADSLFDRQIKRAKLAEEFITDFRKAMEGE